MSKELIFLIVIFLVLIIGLIVLTYFRSIDTWRQTAIDFAEELAITKCCITSYRTTKNLHILYLNFDISNTPFVPMMQKIQQLEDIYPDVYTQNMSTNVVLDSCWENIFPEVKRFYDNNECETIYYTITRDGQPVKQYLYGKEN